MSVQTPHVPELSLAQRFAALEKANAIRTIRKDYKRQLAAGERYLADDLLDPPWWLVTAKVVDMIVAMPKYGRIKSDAALKVCRLSPSKTVGGLTDRQRTELAAHLRRPVGSSR